MIRDLGSTLDSQLPRPVECDLSPGGRAGAEGLQKESGGFLAAPRPAAGYVDEGPQPGACTCLAQIPSLIHSPISSSNIHRGAVMGSTWIKSEDNNSEPKGLLLPSLAPRTCRRQPVNP